ncbi:hypothetical protein [Paenimyroides baculatum]|uniref:Uncharacterized protein n=1 Tax=Paenimyroides baculatum TaxID=2608000 RepID=A0A5M6CKS2_9FLAO|nr:hypothetical protein [Paenimyroides baculatum]KAA5535626.1 hypothetical protein F0460_07545 [Paenimyroides baculatum]
MKKYYPLIMLFLCFTTCTTKNELKGSQKEVVRDIELTIPVLDKRNELKDHPSVLRWLRQVSIDSLTELHAAYFPESMTIDNFENNKENLEDYFVIYSRKDDRQIIIEDSDLEEILIIQTEKLKIQRMTIHEAWENIQVDHSFLKPREFLLLDKYKISDRCQTAIFLMKQFPSQPNYITIIVLNLVNIDQQLIYGAYYLELKNKKSITDARKISDKIIEQLLENN